MAVITLPVARITLATPRSRLLTIGLGVHMLDFRPGQAVMVAARGRSPGRPYSIACSPEQAAESRCVELLVSTEPDGSGGPSLGPLAPGMLVEVEGPFGGFTLPDVLRAGRVLFVAGGTGIAPLRSMLDHLLRQPCRPRMSLLYSARRGDEFAFIHELRAHAESGSLELHQTITREAGGDWTGGRGRIGRDHFEAVLHDAATTLCFACGPEALVRESVATLRALGVPDTQVRTESWLAAG